MLPVIEITLPPQIQGGNVPAFLAKLWKMVDNPDADNLIGWSDDGGSFIIKNQGEFTKTMLPYYYKHSNMASFVRQLNMYGFHKVTSVESGGLKGDNEEIEFAHPFFLRGQEHLLDQIKRKVNPGGGRGGGGVAHQFVPSIKSEKVTEVLTEVTILKERQEDIDSKLENMRSENDALWGEVMSLRQKHSQQQKIVNKLIQFLSALLQPRGMKRSFGRSGAGGHAVGQLAIEDTGADMFTGGATPAKQQRLSESTVPSGATIQEIPSHLDNNQLSSVLDNLSRSQQQAFPDPVGDIIVDSPVVSGSAPVSDTKYTMVDPVSVNASLVPKRPVLQRELSREDFDSVILNNEKDLDNLKDILSGQITLDSSLVNSLFTVDQDPTSMLFSDFTLNPADNDEHSGASDGAKPVTYNPSLFELADEGEGNIFQGSEDKFFNETVLHTPLVQDDKTNPLSKLLKNK